MGDSLYFRIGIVLGYIAALITFVSAYIFCIKEYGFLWGFGFGWLPSALLAVLVGGATCLLWGLVAALLVLAIYFALKG